MTIYVKAVKKGFITSKTASYTFTVKKEVVYDWGDVAEEDRDGFDTPDDIPAGIWATGVKDADYIGTEVTFDKLHVYSSKTRLKADTDYTVKYSNNLNASTGNTTASVLISGKGNYTGSKKIDFKIRALSLGDGKVNHENLKVADVQAEDNGKIIKLPTTVVYKVNGTDAVLKEGTDFTYDYSAVKAGPGTYTVGIIGKGNFTGKATFTETIYAKKSRTDISKLSFKKIAAQKADGSPKEPQVVITDKVTNKKKPYTLVLGVDYEVSYLNNISVGTASVIINGKGDKYAGTKTLTFKISGVALSKAKFSIGSVIYSGEAQKPTYALTYKANKNAKNETLVEGTDYTVTVSNNIKKGKGTLTFTGAGRFTGTVKKSFKISPLNFDSGKVTVVCAGALSGASSSSKQNADLGKFTYTKRGVKPQIVLTFNGEELALNSDYRVKYSNNNAVNGKKTPTITITGKGNFTGKFTRTFTINEASLSNATVKASDMIASGKAGCKTTIVAYDTNGEKLTAGKDYDKKFEYTYAGAASIKRKQGKTISEVTVQAGDKVDVKNDIIPAGTQVRVTVYGKGCYGGSKTVTFKFIAKKSKQDK
jgi:hypothetical protein